MTEMAGMVATRSRGGSGADAYRLRTLSLVQFRTYDRLELTPGPAPVVLTGPNGVGKTNILEAISWLGPGRGLRNATLAEPERRTGDKAPGNWAVSATVEQAGGRVRIGTGMEPGRETRRVRIDGESASGPAALARQLRLSWLTPAMDRLFSDARAQRLKFLDRMVQGLDPAHGSRLNAYDRAARDRMRLLEGAGSEPRWLDALERTMAEQGVAVAAARVHFVERLGEQIAARPPGPFPKAGLQIAGLLEAAIGSEPAVDLEMAFEARLAAGRGEDARAGRTLQGPHRSDLVVTHLEKGMPARDCSTGEQKALLIGLILAHAELTAKVSGMTPVLLLDEVAAHLDPSRRAALFTKLASLGGQVFMTGTDEALFEALPPDAEIFEIAAGESHLIRPVSTS